jgi:cytochrome P450
MNSPAPSLGYTKAEAFLAYADDRLGTLMRCAQKAPVVELFPGQYVVTGPEAAMVVLRLTGDAFRLPVSATGQALNDGRGDEHYDAWMGTRKVISALLKDDTFISDITDEIVTETIVLGEKWTTQLVVEQPLPDLMDLASRAAARAFFGLDIDQRSMTSLSLQIRTCSANEEANRSATVTLKPWVRPFVPRYRRQARGFAALEAIIEKLTAQASGRSFSGVLREAGRSEKQIAHAGVTLLRAGSEGTAGAFNWGLHALAAGIVTADDLTDPGRSPNVMSELLRLYPPVWAIRRRAHRDIDVDGFLIPAGCEVMLSPYATQRTASDYPEPEEFRPERWEGLRPHRGAYLPYGAGSQWCVGAPLAEAERAAVLDTLAQRFVFERRGQLKEVTAGTLRPSDETLIVSRR